jgi:hypothetical protein
MPRTSLDFEYNGKEYSLCYNIDTLISLGRSGLLEQIARGEQPVTMTRDLFFAAFETNHKYVSNNVKHKIYKEFSKTVKSGSLLDSMLEMLAGTCETVVETCEKIVKLFPSL